QGRSGQAADRGRRGGVRWAAGPARHAGAGRGARGPEGHVGHVLGHDAADVRAGRDGHLRTAPVVRRAAGVEALPEAALAHRVLAAAGGAGSAVADVLVVDALVGRVGRRTRDVAGVEDAQLALEGRGGNGQTLAPRAATAGRGAAAGEPGAGERGGGLVVRAALAGAGAGLDGRGGVGGEVAHHRLASGRRERRSHLRLAAAARVIVAPERDV